eukprot:COSAG05_NODE_12151_length_481_cov_0.777487_1_plen_64_part_10
MRFFEKTKWIRSDTPASVCWAGDDGRAQAAAAGRGRVPATAARPVLVGHRTWYIPNLSFPFLVF